MPNVMAHTIGSRRTRQNAIREVLSKFAHNELFFNSKNKIEMNAGTAITLHALRKDNIAHYHRQHRVYHGFPPVLSHFKIKPYEVRIIA